MIEARNEKELETIWSGSCLSPSLVRLGERLVSTLTLTRFDLCLQLTLAPLQLLFSLFVAFCSKKIQSGKNKPNTPKPTTVGTSS